MKNPACSNHGSPHNRSSPGHGVARGMKRLSISLQRFQLNAQKCLSSNSLRSHLIRGGGTLVIAAAAAVPASGPEDASGKTSSSSSQNRARTLHPEFGDPRRKATDSLMAINLMCFALQWLTRDKLTYMGLKINSLIAAGEWWRLLTPVVLHSSLIHLAVNTFSLHNLGPHLESLSGSPRFVAIYLGSAVVGTTASYMFTKAPSLGASGAVFGIGAAMGIFYWRHREELGGHSERMLNNLGSNLAVNFALALVAKNLDNWAHLGGMVGGAVLALLLGPRFIWQRDGSVVDRPPIPWLAHRSPDKLSPQKQKKTITQQATQRTTTPTQPAKKSSSGGTGKPSSGGNGGESVA